MHLLICKVGVFVFYKVPTVAYGKTMFIFHIQIYVMKV
jgi:hypothetical protein